MSTRLESPLSSKKRGASRGTRWALWSSLAIVAACGSAVTETPSVSDYTTDHVSGSGGSGGGASSGTAGMEGLPCEVAALLAAKCISCHTDPPANYAPEALLTYADLTAPSKSDPAKSNAVKALERMKSASSPMPPAPAKGPTAAELAAFQAWVDAGTPMGSCGGIDAGPSDAGPNPFDAPAQCTSMVTSQVDDGAAMSPGLACITCHNDSNTDGKKAPDLTLGGTAYATPHEPDNCNAKVVSGPAISKAVVEITDKNGVVITLALNAVGNFYRKSSVGAVALPYTAKIVYDGRERVMTAPQTSGDCNHCHTQAGTENAPGRILLP